MEPLYMVKPDLDPLEMYNLDGEIEDIQSTRMKLAMLKAKNKISENNVEIWSQADQDLENVIELENYQEQPDDLIKVSLIPKIDVIHEKKLLITIQGTFSQIFQAMIIMLDSNALFTQLPEDADKSSKRSKEFEIRLNRSVFETKQQVSYFNLKIII